MSKNKVIKSVSFNITVADDVEMLNAIKRRNFSGYVKKLINQDIRVAKVEKGQIEPIEAVKREVKKEAPKELTAAEKIARMKAKKPGKNTGPKLF